MENIEQKTQPENTKKEWISPEMTELSINTGGPTLPAETEVGIVSPLS